MKFIFKHHAYLAIVLTSMVFFGSLVSNGIAAGGLM